MGRRIDPFLCATSAAGLRRVIGNISQCVAEIATCLRTNCSFLKGTLCGGCRLTSSVTSRHAHCRSNCAEVHLDEPEGRVPELGCTAWPSGSGVLLPARRHAGVHAAG